LDVVEDEGEDVELPVESRPQTLGSSSRQLLKKRQRRLSTTTLLEAEAAAVAAEPQQTTHRLPQLAVLLTMIAVRSGEE